MKNVKSVQLFFVLAGLCLLSGCALTPAKIGLNYAPQVNVNPVPGAKNVMVKVLIMDQRLVNDSVGRKMNGYGMEMASISATNNVPDLIKHAMETELVNRGFGLGDGDTVTIVGDLSKFFNEFKEGFFAGDAVAEVDMNVTIRNTDGTIVYSRLIDGRGTVENIQFASGTNARIALEGALRDAMATLFSDPTFTGTLVKAQSPRQTTQRGQ